MLNNNLFPNKKFKQKIRNYINKLPYIRNITTSLEVCYKELEVCKKEYKTCISELERHNKELKIYKVDFPPGHYHSPIVSIKELKERENEIFSIKSKDIVGINLNEEKQLKLLEELHKYYPVFDSHRLT